LKKHAITLPEFHIGFRRRDDVLPPTLLTVDELCGNSSRSSFAAVSIRGIPLHASVARNEQHWLPAADSGSSERATKQNPKNHEKKNRHSSASRKEASLVAEFS